MLDFLCLLYLTRYPKKIFVTGHQALIRITISDGWVTGHTAIRIDSNSTVINRGAKRLREKLNLATKKKNGKEQ